MFKLSFFSSSRRSQSFSPLLHCAVDNALIKTFPLVHDALAKFFNICNLPLVVDPLLQDSPYRIVDRLKIRTIGRPQTWLDEIRCDYFQQLDRLASSVSWRSILPWKIKIFRILSDFRQQVSGQQHFTIVLSIDFHSWVNKANAGSSQSGHGNRHHHGLRESWPSAYETLRRNLALAGSKWHVNAVILTVACPLPP